MHGWAQPQSAGHQRSASASARPAISRRLQAWREANELENRELMRGGAWVIPRLRRSQESPLLIPRRWRGDHAKHGVAWRFPFEFCERRIGRDVEIALDEGRERGERAFVDRRGLDRGELDDRNVLRVVAAGKRRLTGGPQVAHPVHLAEGRSQPAFAIPFQERDRVVRGSPLLRPGTVSSAVLPIFTPRRNKEATMALLIRTNGVTR